MASRKATGNLRMALFVQALQGSVKAVYSKPGRPCSEAGNGKRTQNMQGLVRLTGEGNGTPLQYSCLASPMDGGAWWAAVHGVAESRARLSDFSSLFTFMHWRRKWQPTPVFLPGEFQGQGSLVGCRLWGRTESDTTEVT